MSHTKQALQERGCRATLRPTRHLPGSGLKIEELELRASQELPLFDARDTQLTEEGSVKGGSLSIYHPGEVEELQKIGYQGEWVGGVFFVTRLVKVEAGEVSTVEEKPDRHGRHRSDKERAEASTPEARAREAERKRKERRRKKEGAA